MSFFGGGGGAAASTSNEPKDIEVSDPPSDSISSISFSTAGEFLAVASWNNEVCATEKKAVPIDPNLFKVRIYEVNPQGGQTQGKAMYQHQGPVLGVCWNKVSLLYLKAGFCAITNR